MVKVLGDGAGSSRMLQVRGPMMARGDYSSAAMKVAVWQKDMRIIAEFARSLECPTPLFAATTAIYNAAMAQGFAEEDTASVCAVLEAMAKGARAEKRTQLLIGFAAGRPFQGWIEQADLRHHSATAQE